MFASGWWPAFAGWDSSPTGSLYCVSESCFLFDYMLFLTFWVYLTRLQLLNSFPRSFLHHRIGQIISPVGIGWKMRREQRADLFHAVHKCFGEITTSQARLHSLNDFTPEIIAAFGMNTSVPDHGKLMRHRSDENQHRVPQRCLIHFQSGEAKAGRMEGVARFSAADEDADITACSFFGGSNGRDNSVVVDNLQKMMRFHAKSEF